jgi:ATP synthase F1 gamma subunit
MSAIRDLQERLQQTETAQFVTTMLRDISATRLHAIRSEFEANQAYYTELHELMELIKNYATRQGVSIQTPETKPRIYVALTANRRFYGQLNNEIMHSFAAALAADTEADGFVIGQTGEQYVAQHAADVAVVGQTSFAKDVPTTAEIATVIERLTAYNEVMVVHPTFVNSFRQEARVTDITHQPTKTQPSRKASVDYIFEPDLPALLRFFRTQVRMTLFQRVLLETRVALTGARLMKMQRARERASELVQTERRAIHKQISTIQSMRLLETFTGFVSDRDI